jgi:hypothetical protein
VLGSGLPPHRPDIGSWDPVAHGPSPLRGLCYTDISVEYRGTQPLSEEKAGERGGNSGKGGGGGDWREGRESILYRYTIEFQMALAKLAAPNSPFLAPPPPKMALVMDLYESYFENP